VGYKYINTSYIQSVAGDDKEIIHELVNLFREQVAEVSSEMKLLLEKKDYYNLGLLAHKAKSSVAIIGMADLASILKSFELEAKEGLNTGMYATYIARFESDAKGALEELDSFIKDL
jgi:HPt (histidine-containing phosphotransfer) domain-containing protein